MRRLLHRMAILNAGALVIWTWTPDSQERCRQTAIRQTNHVILFRSCSDANSVSVGWFYGSKLALSGPAADLTYVICLSLLHRWAFARHMAASEQFVCAICSQLAIETFCSVVTRQCDCEGVPMPPTARFRVPKRQNGFQTSEQKPVIVMKLFCQIKGCASVPPERN